ncbi:MAG: NBR1-Ig-like domain-containing protein [Anaerolineaceae bacterium]
MFRKRFAFLGLILVSGLLLSACNLTGAPTMDPAALQATVDEGVARAMKTEASMLTSTAAALPSSTFTATATTAPMATKTSTVTMVPPTATKTVMPATQKPSATATPQGYACSIVSTSPSTGVKMGINADFDAVWKVKNTGTKDWEPGFVDLTYVSGTKMHTGADVYDVNIAVAKNTETTLTVDMKAPSTAGKYTTTFALVMEGKTMCTLTVSIEATP